MNKNTVDFSKNITPIEFIREMYRNTAEDGTLYLNNWYDVDCEDCLTYNKFIATIDWNTEDLDYAINEFNQLYDELNIIADHLDALDGTPQVAQEILPDELVASYCIFVSPLEAKNKDELNAQVIGRVSEGACGYELIRHAQRLCRLISLDAPEIIVQNEARMLAASLVIHLCGDDIKVLG